MADTAVTGSDLTTLVSTEILDKVKGGTITLSALAAALAPPTAGSEVVASVASPREITEEQRTAIRRLPEVYGKINPMGRRALTAPETSSLLDERDTLKKVEAMVTARVADITLIAHNHLDAKIDESVPQGKRPPMDAKGHYIVEGRLGVPEVAEEFSREVSEGSASLSESSLKALVDSGDLTAKQYLAMTSQVRVIDEAKIMIALRKDPTLIRAIAKATKPGKKSVSMYVRKKK